MKALVLHKPGHGSIETIPEPVGGGRDILLKVRMVGLCGSDLNSFRGLNPLVTFPRIPGHEVSATVVQATAEIAGSLRGRTWRFLRIQAAVNAHHAGGDVQMPANSTRLSECKGTVLSPNSS